MARNGPQLGAVFLPKSSKRGDILAAIDRTGFGESSLAISHGTVETNVSCGRTATFRVVSCSGSRTFRPSPVVGRAPHPGPAGSLGIWGQSGTA